MAEQRPVDGNFAFTYTLDPEFYDHAYTAEQKSRTNYRESGQHIRQAMEMLMTDIINDCGIGNYVWHDARLNKENKSLQKLALGLKYTVLQRPKEMIAAGYVQSNKEFNANPPLPQLGKISYQQVCGNRNSDRYEFLRCLGNTCSHSDTEAKDIILTYEVICEGLHAMYNIARHHWKKRCKEEGIRIPDFSPDRMPIDRYHITNAIEPHDHERSRCRKEFEGYRTNTEGREVAYAILRLYNRKDVSEEDRNFILRNQQSYTEAVSAVPDRPIGLASLQEVTSGSADASEFYILAYEFPKKPRALSNKVLQEMPMAARMRMSARIARCLYELHHSDVPISHRMLNPECIYMCEFKDWVPYIIKFDFAKITNGDAAAKTVFMQARQARERISDEERLNKYIAPEWDALDQNTNSDQWSRVDVYSLGVLLSDVLYGKILPQEVDLEELEAKGVSIDLLELLAAMRSDDPEDRPALGEICERLDAMVG